jgi:hypothetical protein
MLMRYSEYRLIRLSLAPQHGVGRGFFRRKNGGKYGAVPFFTSVLILFRPIKNPR